MNTKQLVASLGVVLSLVTTSIASADNAPATKKVAAPAPKPASAKKKPAATKKPKAILAVAAPAESTASEPAPKSDATPISDLPPAPPATPHAAPAPVAADKPQTDRSATRDAEDKPISIAPLAGYASEGLRLGFGVRAGYTIPVGNRRDAVRGGVYVGGAFMYHLGFSIDAGPYGSSSFSAFYPSAEVGYEIRPVDRLSIRPYGGAGVLFATISTKGLIGKVEQEASISTSSLAIYPGCVVNYDVPSTSFFAGGDARLLIPVEGTGVSLGLFASGGFRF